jgi:hypothetical protein
VKQKKKRTGKSYRTSGTPITISEGLIYMQLESQKLRKWGDTEINLKKLWPIFKIFVENDKLRVLRSPVNLKHNGPKQNHMKAHQHNCSKSGLKVKISYRKKILREVIGFDFLSEDNGVIILK